MGTPEQVIRGGEVVQIRVKPSDSILRLLLQASNPKKYGRLSRGGTTRRQIEKRLRKEIEEALKPRIEAELKAKGWRPPPTREEGRAMRREIEAMLSDFNRKMGGDR